MINHKKRNRQYDLSVDLMKNPNFFNLLTNKRLILIIFPRNFTKNLNKSNLTTKYRQINQK